MKSTVIYRGEPVEVPSFHADRLIRAGKATLPKAKGSRTAPVSDAPTAGDSPADSSIAAPQSPVTQETPAAQIAPKQDAPPVAKEPTARRRYSRRDMKAQD